MKNNQESEISLKDVINWPRAKFVLWGLIIGIILLVLFYFLIKRYLW